MGKRSDPNREGILVWDPVGVGDLVAVESHGRDSLLALVTEKNLHWRTVMFLDDAKVSRIEKDIYQYSYPDTKLRLISKA